MKRLIALVLTMILALNILLVGCGTKEEDVEVTIPEVLAGDLSNFDEKEFLEGTEGVKSAKVTEDNSLIITMGKSRYDAMMKEMKEGLLHSFEEISKSPETAYIEDIDYSDDFKKVTLTVNKEDYEAAFDFTHILVGVLVGTYQVYSGDEFHVEVVIEDGANGEEINSIIYPDSLEE